MRRAALLSTSCGQFRRREIHSTGGHRPSSRTSECPRMRCRASRLPPCARKFEARSGAGRASSGRWLCSPRPAAGREVRAASWFALDSFQTRRVRAPERRDLLAVAGQLGRHAARMGQQRRREFEVARFSVFGVVAYERATVTRPRTRSRSRQRRPKISPRRRPRYTPRAMPT